MNIKPLGDRVLLKAIGDIDTTESGIYIPETANKERPYIYEVLALGDGNDEIKEIPLSIGDKVLSGQYSGDDIKIDGEEFKIVPFKFILAIVK